MMSADVLKKRCGCGTIMSLREGCAACADRRRAELHVLGICESEDGETADIAMAARCSQNPDRWSFDARHFEPAQSARQSPVVDHAVTNQEAFDKAALHLLRQGRKSQDSDDICLYRGPGGTKCAIGALITDDEYEYRMELLPVSAIKHKCLSLAGLDGYLLKDMQTLHDAYDVAEWPRRLQEVAARFGLSDQVVRDFGDTGGV